MEDNVINIFSILMISALFFQVHGEDGVTTTTASGNCDTSCPIQLAMALRRVNESSKQLTQALLAVATCQSRSRTASSDYEARIDRLEKSVRMLQLNNNNNRGSAASYSSISGIQNAAIPITSANSIDYSNLAPEVQARMQTLEKTVNVLQAQLGGLGIQTDQSAPCQTSQHLFLNGNLSETEAYQQRIIQLENSVRLLQQQLSFGSSTGGSGNGSPSNSNSNNIPMQFPAIPPALTTPHQSATQDNFPANGDYQDLHQGNADQHLGTYPPQHLSTSQTPPASSTMAFTIPTTLEPVTAAPNDKSYWEAVSQTPSNRLSTSPCEVRDVLALHRTKQILAICLTGDVYIYDTTASQMPRNFSALPRRRLTVPSYINSGVAFIFNSAVDETNDRLYFTVFPWRSGILMTSLSRLLDPSQSATVTLLQYFYRGTGDRNFGGLAVDSSPMAAGVDDSSINAVVYCADELMKISVGVWLAPSADLIAELKVGGSFQPSRLAVLPPPEPTGKRIVAVSDMSNNQVIFFAIGDRKFEAKGAIMQLQRPEGVTFNKQGHLVVAENGGGKISVYAVNRADYTGALLWSAAMRCDVQNCAPWAVATMETGSDEQHKKALIVASTYTPSSAIVIFQ